MERSPTASRQPAGLKILRDSVPAVVTGSIAALALVLNTLFWVPVLLFFSLLRLLLSPVGGGRAMAPVLLAIAEAWISCNSAWMRLTQPMHWDVQGVDGLDRRAWYLVSCNHQSWVDVLVLQHVFNRRIPLLKFFLKKQLLWVPVMGLAWWALDFPFMHRHSKAYLKRHPEMRGKDQATTRKACEKFALVPTSVMSFAEGTRFTVAKHRSQASPYLRLLRPKAGGMALALNAMGEQFKAVLDVTIVYPAGAPTFWQFLCGRMDHVVVRVRSLPVPRDLVGADYAADAAHRAAFAQWVQQLWLDKDRQMAEILSPRAR